MNDNNDPLDGFLKWRATSVLDWQTGNFNTGHFVASKISKDDERILDLVRRQFPDTKTIEIRRGLSLEIALDALNANTLARAAKAISDQYGAGQIGSKLIQFQLFRAHFFFSEAEEAYTKIGDRGGLARNAVNHANLLLNQFKNGDAASAKQAHAHFRKATEILSFCGSRSELALCMHDHAGVFTEEYASGEINAATEAHTLYSAASKIFEECDLLLEVARASGNQATLYDLQYRRGEAATADKAHKLYDKAIELGRGNIGLEAERLVAMHAYNNARLYIHQFELGATWAVAEARPLLEEALDTFRRHQNWFWWVKAVDLLLGILEFLKSWSSIEDVVQETLFVMREQVSSSFERDRRNTILSMVDGFSVRGAAAAMARHDLRGALLLLEVGRAQQLGVRLREVHAKLNETDSSRLRAARDTYQQCESTFAKMRANFIEVHEAAEHAEAQANVEKYSALSEQREAIGAELSSAEQALEAAHGALNALKTEFSLDDLTVPVPSPGELAEALGGAALVQAVAGRDGGWLLLLAPGAADWQAMPVAALTTAAVDKVTGRYQEAVGTFQAGKLPDGTQCPEGSLDPVNAFSQALDATLLPGDAEAPGIWDLIAGPIHWALQAAGMAPAAGAALAPEVVLCLPADLAMLPIHAARDPATGRPFHEDYASRLVPSLGALITAAARARRPVKPNVLTVTDPLDDLGIGAHPAAELFPADARTELAGYGGNPARPNIATWPGLAAAVEQSQPGFLAYFGHSHWDRRDGEGSGLVLAPELDAEGKIPGMKDLATPARIRGLALSSTRLVFSASCGGAGLSLVVAKDELGGLPSAWLEAGAAGMISSLYSVLTGPAEDIMKTTFAAMLGESLAPVQALRRAQMALARAFEPAPDPAPAEVPISNPFLDASRTSGPPVTARTPRRSNLHLNLHPTANIAAFVMFGA